MRRADGRDVYFCDDPALPRAQRGKAVVRADAVDALLDVFRSGAQTQDAVERFGDRAAIAENVTSLMEAGLIRGWSAHRDPQPSFEIEITALCNADCIMCPRGELRAAGHMTEQTFERLLALVTAHPSRGAIIQGIGEPSLHPNLVTWSTRLRAVLDPEAPLIVVTNGIRTNRQLYAQLIAAGVTQVQWSLHALDPATITEVFGTKLAVRALENLEACLAFDSEHLGVNFVLMDLTRVEMDRVRQWLTVRGLPASQFRVIPVFSRGGTIDTQALFSHIHRPAQAPCVYVRKSMFIAWNGDLLPCSNDIAGAHPYGNLEDADAEQLSATWNTQLASTHVSFEICRACNHQSRDSLPTSWLALATDGTMP
jgi:radical SAM protein with 4Fe4S-binding SPASM domain